MVLGPQNHTLNDFSTKRLAVWKGEVLWNPQPVGERGCLQFSRPRRRCGRDCRPQTVERGMQLMLERRQKSTVSTRPATRKP